VAWSKVTQPTELGGLGVLDLTTLGYALRLRWEWLTRTDSERLWTSLPHKNDHIVRAMFEASTSVQVGSGTRALFWRDRWLDGASIDQFAPDVVATVQRRRAYKSRSVADALQDSQWIGDITGSLSVSALNQYVLLWSRIQTVVLHTDAQDKFIWKWAPNQQCSSLSAYRAFFIRQSGLPGAKALSKMKATPRCKFSFG
jgi:hypothetical protein